MAYNLPPPNITNSSLGLGGVLGYEASQVSTLGPGILTLIFIVMFIGSFFSKNRQTGGATHLAFSFTVSAFITTILSFILFFYEDIVNLYVVSAFIGMTIIGFAWTVTVSND